jgi:alpha-galactosidase
MPIIATDNGWILATNATGYALGLTQAGLLAHRYWGARLPAATDYPTTPEPVGASSFDSRAHLTPEEYPGHGGIRYVDPCLKLAFADGVRDLVLRFGRATIDDGEIPELRIELVDAFYPFQVTLIYRVYEAYDLIERAVTLSNTGDATIVLERAWSAQWHLPAGHDYHLSHLTGRWSDEWHLRRERLGFGIKRLESRRLTTSHQHNPWFALDRGDAGEDAGDVWFGALAWSGNWVISAEVTDYATTRLSLGINDWDFAWRLQAGESFVTPGSVAGYTADGFGGASRIMHCFAREQLLPHGTMPRQVLYNSWEATGFNVDEASQVALATRAAAIGVELFVLDDGWFSRRNQDSAGLGDWWPDEQKFPRGLQSLIAQVNDLGMDFGLWIEPEMVNRQSALYEAHPDWVLHYPTRDRGEARNQLILNLARTDVQDHLIATIDRLLSTNNIAFIKWDMNRNASEPGWPEAGGDQREVWVRYVQGFYRIWETLRQRHPDVIWQSCSGGGGRADLGMMRLADQIWISDNTEPSARIAMQEGYSRAYPACTMESWVTDSGSASLSLAFRFHVSMCGVLGIGGDLGMWDEPMRQEAARWVALYKEIRQVVQFGDLYRLRSAQEHAFSAVQYVSVDRSDSVLFAFRTHLAEPARLPPLYPRGLDAEAVYTIEGQATPRSGRAWMRDGLRVTFGDFESVVIRIRGR